MSHQLGAYTVCSKAPGTNTAKVCLARPQWNKMCLILERFEAPGKGDMLGGGTLSEARGKEKGMRNCGGDQEGAIEGM